LLSAQGVTLPPPKDYWWGRQMESCLAYCRARGERLDVRVLVDELPS